MKRFYCLSLKQDTNLDRVWNECAQLGFENLYSMEEPGQLIQLLGEFSGSEIPHALEKWVEAIEERDPPMIDWQTQWESNTSCQGGLIPLETPSGTYFLKPGPGFGDTSHPTTQLMLEMMIDRVQDQVVCDVGCGSGVLSIAAIGMGAIEVEAVDIDSEAIAHAYENARLNSMENCIHFYAPEELVSSHATLFLMNMIPAEQAIAWNSLPLLYTKGIKLLVSGILEEKREGYLKECQNRGWEVLSEKAKSGWLALEIKSSDGLDPLDF